MTVKRTEIQDGIFIDELLEAASSSKEDVDAYNKEFNRQFNPDEIIKDIENEIKRIRKNLSCCDSALRHTRGAEYRLSAVKKNLDENNTAGAMYNMYAVMCSLRNAQLFEYEGGIKHKFHLSELGKMGNNGYTNSRAELHAEWQNEANDLKNKHPTWKKNRIATEIHEAFLAPSGGKRPTVRTISNNIQI